MKRYKADDRWVIDTLTDTIVTAQNICDLLNENACELPAVEEKVKESEEEIAFFEKKLEEIKEEQNQRLNSKES